MGTSARRRRYNAPHRGCAVGKERLLNLLTGLFVVAGLGVAALLIAWGGNRAAETRAAAESQSPPLPPVVPWPTATPRPPVAVGGVYTLRKGDMLWVQRLGMEANTRAEADRDERTKRQIAEVFERFFPDAGARVRVLTSEGRVKHLEVLDGPHAGRRGWTDLYSDDQFMP